MADLLVGPRASGRIGDVLLENDRIRVVIAMREDPVTFNPYRGGILDADVVRTDGVDRLVEVFAAPNLGTVIDAADVEIIEDGSNRLEAIVRVSGAGAGFSALGGTPVSSDVVTEYRITPDVPYIEVRTTAANEAAEPWDVFTSGIELEVFAQNETGLPAGSEPWVAATGNDIAYAWVPDQLSVDGTQAPALKLAGTYDRRLFIAADAGALTADLYSALGVPTGSLVGSIRDLAGDVAEDAVLTVRAADGTVLTRVRPGTDGAFATRVPAGVLELVAESASRGNADSLFIQVVQNRVSTVIVLLPATGQVTFSAVDGASATPIPARLALFRQSDGVLVGEAYSGGSAAQVRARPGEYFGVVSRGPEWTIVTSNVTVLAGQTVSYSILGPVATLDRVVDTAGLVAADLHVHTHGSTDSGVTPDDRLLALAAEGIEVVATTDHDRVTEVTSTLLAVIPGSEITIPGYGQFNAFPLPAGTDGSRVWFDVATSAPRSAADVLASLRAMAGDRVLQINHPRSTNSGEAGYFDEIALDASDLSATEPLPADFDAVETTPGAAFADWLALVATGRAVTATVGSDAHDSSRPGYPRTLVFAGSTDTADITTALRTQRAIVSSGVVVTTPNIGQVVDESGSGCVFSIDVHIESPAWASFDTVQLYENTTNIVTQVVAPTLTAGRFAADVSLPVTPADDVFYVVSVSGSGTLHPVSNEPVYGYTNPVYVDCQGNGWTPPGL